MDAMHHPLADVLYDKAYECPICSHTFTNKAIRLRKNQVVSIDSDLYARYSTVNPLFYDAIVCPECGYGALTSIFDKVTATQKSWIKQEILLHYKKRRWNVYATPLEAITKHQLALVSSITKRSKMGEQAYICLHIGWLYRDLEDSVREKLYLTKAFDGFRKALESEHFPILSLDEITTTYIVADLAFRLGEYDSCRAYLAQVLLNSSPPRLKDRALDLKQKLHTLNSKEQ